MTQEEAKKILTQALNQAFKNGSYSLKDASILIQALNILFPTMQTEENAKI